MNRTFAALVVLLIATSARLEAGVRPFNGKIAFDSNRDGNREIYVTTEAGVETRLTNNAGTDTAPAWSPDGSKIAFDRNGQIMVMNADGTNVTQLTNSVNGNGSPQWSPDGGAIAFNSLRDGNFEIYVMNADGSAQTRLTDNAAGDFSPAWSPDGQRLLFRSNRDGNDEIYVMSRDGSGQTRLTNNVQSDQAPKFSPDGRKIVFTRTTSPSGGSPQVFVMNADGTNAVQLTSISGINSGPVFSPDGTRIAFHSSRDVNFEIYTMDVDGSNQGRITHNAGEDTTPSWQPVFLRSTIGVYRPTTGEWLLRNSNTNGSADLTLTFGGLPGDLPVTGDWNGDGRTDIGVFHDGTFRLAVLKVAPACFGCGVFTTIVDPLAEFTFGQAGDRPIAGDWNNDGKDDVGVYREGAKGSSFILRVPTINIVVVCDPLCRPIAVLSFQTVTHFLGTAGDLPVVGDWNGDGVDTIGVYHPDVNSVFVVTDDFGEATATASFGSFSDLPIAGDWTGAGHDRVGLFHPAFISTTSLATQLFLGPDIIFKFGTAGDLPVAGHWNFVP